jgi:hypothetical protein
LFFIHISTFTEGEREEGERERREGERGEKKNENYINILDHFCCLIVAFVAARVHNRKKKCFCGGFFGWEKGC